MHKAMRNQIVGRGGGRGVVGVGSDEFVVVLMVVVVVHEVVGDTMKLCC